MNPLEIHLKFPDEATATSLMLDTGLLRQINDQLFEGEGQMIDIIGPIYF
jgi:hypothetical protein